MSKARDKRLKAEFNLNKGEYEKILAFQQGNCAITGKKSKKLVIDHSHASGQVRGVIDWIINKGLALFRDNPELLRRAADYLERPTATQALGEDVFGVLGKVGKKAKNRRYGPNGSKTPQPR